METDFIELVEDRFMNSTVSIGPRQLDRLAFYLCVTLGRRPTPEFMQTLTRKISKSLDLFEPQQLSRVLFTYAKLDYRDPAFFARATRRVAARVAELNARDMGMLAFAAWRLRLLDARLLGTVATVASKKLPDFTPKGLTTLVWSIG